MNAKEQISFEDAMTELESIVHMLETGKVKLDEAIAAYERGMVLKKICEEKLGQAKAKIDKLQIDKNNKIVGVEPFDADSEK